MSGHVVYVHGLWLHGWEALLLRRRLSQQMGCEARVFRYPSVTADLAANAHALAQFLAGLRCDTLHLVGHSMGGPVILKFFSNELSADGMQSDRSPLPPGRIVLLGSPVRGSLAAQRLARLPFGKRIMGLTAREALLTPHESRWNGARELGVIAGDLALGFGQLLGPLNAPSDGTVLVEETRLCGAKAQLTLPVSHSGMMLSARVARHTAAFLHDGQFGP
ncbi:MAG: esterase/lipase family protein [Steroidobacteraceae bacterium]